MIHSMKTKSIARLVVAAGALTWAAATCFGGPPTFRGIGAGTFALLVSDDGRVVVGHINQVPDHLYAAFRWTPQEGVRLLGFLPHRCDNAPGDTNCPSTVSSVPTGVSADGSVIVGGSGIYDAGFNDTAPFRWTEATGIQEIPGLGLWRDAQGVSADGSVVIGGGEPVSRWTEASGWTTIVDGVNCPYAANPATPLCGVSADASVIAGYIRLADGRAVAAVYSEPQGVALAQSMDDDSLSTGVSSDGRYVVGQTTLGAGSFRAKTGKIGTPLAVPNGSTRSSVYAVADDGTTVGWVGGGVSGAVMWGPDGEPRFVRDVLTEAGLDLTGWSTGRCFDITPDGRTLVGLGRNPAGVLESWIAYLGDAPAACAADWNADAVINSDDFFAFISDFLCGGKGCRSADFNADHSVNSQDFFDYIAAFFEGCP